jgi:hypothetical protein
MRKLKIILPIVAGLLVIIFAGAALAAGHNLPSMLTPPAWNTGHHQRAVAIVKEKLGF